MAESRPPPPDFLNQDQPKKAVKRKRRNYKTRIRIALILLSIYIVIFISSILANLLLKVL